MKLTKTEMETVIRFDEQEQTAEVFTHNSRLSKRLIELSGQRPREVVEQRADHGAVRYTVPKHWIKIKAPRIMTVEQRRVLEAARHKANQSR